MKMTLVVAAAVAVLGLTTSVAFANGSEGEKVTCSPATLHGTYAWGYAATDSGGPYSTSGRESYDGKGHMTWYQLYNSGGFSPFVYSGTGTYTMTADCVANVVYDGFHRSVPYTYFVMPDGDGYFWNNNFDDGTVSGGRVSRISKAQLVRPANEAESEHVTCSLATLHGTYAYGYAATSVNEKYSTSGRESYDGKGHFSWYQLYNSGGYAPLVFSGSGTYTMTADCVASVVYDSSQQSEPYTFFVIPDGDGYFWNNNFSFGDVSGGRVSRISKALLVH